MSMLPLLFSDWWEELDRPHHVHDQHFGMGLHPDHLSVLPTDMFEPLSSAMSSLMGHPHHPHQLRHRSHPGLTSHGHYYRPWGKLLRHTGDDGGVSTVKSDKGNFQVVLDVQQFGPEEVTVKVVDKYVVVEGNHEEKQDDHGWISRKFTRRYLIPEQCNLEEVESKLSTDGILTISVPRKELPNLQGERVVSIQKTGKPAIREKSNEVKKTDEKNEE